MERSWWWKTVGIVLLILLSVVQLLPTIVGDERLPKWFTKHVDAKIQLGLDLQGGIHLVYEVQVDKAVSDKADRIAADIEERVRTHKDHKNVKVKVIREGRDIIEAQFAKPDDLKVLDKTFMADFRNLDQVAKDPVKGTLRLRINENQINEVEDYAIRQAVETIRNRVDEFGVAEPSIRPKGRQIAIELPGLTTRDFERVKQTINRTAQLEFKIVDDKNDFMAKVAEKVPSDGVIKVDRQTLENKHGGAPSMYAQLESKDKDALEKFLESLPKLGLPVPATHQILLGQRPAEDAKGRPLPGEVTWQTYYVVRRAELTGEYVNDAEVNWDDRTGRPHVGLNFDSKGASMFERLTEQHVGERMAIILDEKVNSAPVIQERIGGGRARITLGGFKAPQELMTEAKDLVGVLRSGALPAPLRKVFETQVGPTLGQDAIRRGALAFAIGAGLVILFMLYYYRGAGLICDLALTINMLMIMAALAAFKATLTLPGIGGLVLTVGMAVDANVIIYERIREELALGKSPRAAVDTGFGRAFLTIIDSQLTTAISGVVLWQYGSGPIQGFAVTLLIGIVCSVFTGVFVTRWMFDFVNSAFRPQTLSI